MSSYCIMRRLEGRIQPFRVALSLLNSVEYSEWEIFAKYCSVCRESGKFGIWLNRFSFIAILSLLLYYSFVVIYTLPLPIYVVSQIFRPLAFPFFTFAECNMSAEGGIRQHCIVVACSMNICAFLERCYHVYTASRLAVAWFPAVSPPTN